MANLKIKESAILAAYITVVSLILTKVLGMIGYSVEQLFAFGVTPTTGITATAGVQFLAFLNKFIAFDIASLVTLWISVTIMVVIGTFVMGLGLPQGKSNWQRLTLILLYGTAILYALLVGMQWIGISAAIGLAVWYAVVAASVGLVEKRIKL